MVIWGFVRAEAVFTLVELCGKHHCDGGGLKRRYVFVLLREFQLVKCEFANSNQSQESVKGSGA